MNSNLIKDRKIEEIERAWADEKDTRWSSRWCAEISIMLDHIKVCSVCEERWRGWFAHTQELLNKSIEV